ncbi:3602_t:CDS:2 [Entrophospora sp. SA101]|nr:150_t:CDS:2 [Entrophospora sp. SA101]CAJ0755047.1 3602_t:CDS:2 [Entrophospora sp. SA101]
MVDRKAELLKSNSIESLDKRVSELSKLRNGLIIKYCEEKEQRVRDSYWNFLNIINGCLSDKYLREYSDIFLLAIGTYPPVNNKALERIRYKNRQQSLLKKIPINVEFNMSSNIDIVISQRNSWSTISIESSLSDNCVFVAKQFFKFNNIKTNSNENNDVYCSR